MANSLNKVVSITVTSFLVLEMIFYNIYATKVISTLIKEKHLYFLLFCYLLQVHPWIAIVQTESPPPPKKEEQRRKENLPSSLYVDMINDTHKLTLETEDIQKV